MLPIPVPTKTSLVTVFAPTCLIATAAISGYHCYTTYNHRKLTGNTSYPTSLKLTFALILNGLFTHLTLCVLLDSDISTITFCKSILLTGPPSYVIYKLLMYLILTVKAREYFGNSAFAYSPKKIKIWQGILISWSILNAVSTILLSTISIAEDPNEVPLCSGILFPPFVISMILLDLVGGTGSSYLLIRPMMEMHKLEKQSMKDSIKSASVSGNNVHTGSQKKLPTLEFKRIAKKQAMLSGISVVTSWFALIGVMLTNMHLVFASIDLLMSTLSVLLMYSWNKRVYQILCCCCAGKRVQSEDNVKNMECVIDGADSSHASGIDSSEAAINTTTEIVAQVSTTQNTAVIH